ncbi:GntR family transcriptional regulator [Fusibacter bizertensis]|uniref:GntR family transcriptional regulator n=1 Tax=Fusibacter bizertensis TaxID=1488331 RepID=A0ABT6NCQ4_9FIRM|nr:GntR family transcriptional regulator [Fusibacter bizertensis]MDH8678202.1 GntR family transcriptional regulator [Fusibacter bizertensis]
MHIFISNSSGVPIYEQIKDQIINLIISGELLEGEALPSMRLLAKELRISVITTKRAYEELENEGFIVSQVGKGSFVASKNMDFIREEHLRRMEEHLQKAVELSKSTNLDLESLIDLIKLLYSGE